MSHHPSARELINAATNKKLSPQAQAVLAAFRDEPGSPEIVSVNNQPSPKSNLLRLIDEKLAERKKEKRVRTTKSESNPKSASNDEKATQSNSTPATPCTGQRKTKKRATTENETNLTWERPR